MKLVSVARLLFLILCKMMENNDTPLLLCVIRIIDLIFELTLFMI
jgi:hypothetical protein